MLIPLKVHVAGTVAAQFYRQTDPERRLQVISSSHVTRHTSHATRHTPHATRHTSHVTRHTPHVTRHTPSGLTTLSTPPSCRLKFLYGTTPCGGTRTSAIGFIFRYILPYFGCVIPVQDHQLAAGRQDHGRFGRHRYCCHFGPKRRRLLLLQSRFQ